VAQQGAHHGAEGRTDHQGGEEAANAGNEGQVGLEGEGADTQRANLLGQGLGRVGLTP
jgi:hypothetical protein